MELDDLKSASTYVNNLLLARGLLRDGATIDFAGLGRPNGSRRRKHERQLRFEGPGDEEKQKEEDTDPVKIATQMLNLVHDLVLKRDRDLSQQEQTAQTIVNLRLEANTMLATNRRLDTANADLKRQLTAHELTSRAAESAARAAETSARLLREEVLRVKTLLAQVRTQCANDVRKRDLELARLKAHLSGQQRGSGPRSGVSSVALVAPSCKITRVTSSVASTRNTAEDERQALSVHDAEYSLREETTEFLTQLSQSLSDENDALIMLLRSILSTLKELQEISDSGNPPTTQSESLQVSANSHSSSLVAILPTTYGELSTELEPVLASLRELLSTPSFVSIEEVQVRDDEIQRLKDGWEKMETRWREAVLMMQGWRKRMLSGGDTVNLDEVRAGLQLGQGLDNYMESSEAEHDIAVPTEIEGEIGDISGFADESVMEIVDEGSSLVDQSLLSDDEHKSQVLHDLSPALKSMVLNCSSISIDLTDDRGATEVQPAAADSSPLSNLLSNSPDQLPSRTLSEEQSSSHRQSLLTPISVPPLSETSGNVSGVSSSALPTPAQTSPGKTPGAATWSRQKSKTDAEVPEETIHSEQDQQQENKVAARIVRSRRRTVNMSPEYEGRAETSFNTSHGERLSEDELGM